MLGSDTCCVQVRGRVDTMQLGSFDQAVEDGGRFGSAARLGAVMVLASHNRTSECAFGLVIVERYARIAQEERKPRPRSLQPIREKWRLTYRRRCDDRQCPVR